tara:strand:+ start:22187 stop:22525 length:339 start_codon:yes stop_codon:yes gene_type:complete
MIIYKFAVILIVAFLSLGQSLAFAQLAPPNVDTVATTMADSCHHDCIQMTEQIHDGHGQHMAAGHCLGCGTALAGHRFRLPAATLTTTVTLAPELPLAMRLVHFRPPKSSID